MQQYLDLLRDIKENGTVKTDRTGTGTTSVFGRQLRFDLNDGFPLVTTKKVSINSIIHELLWFLKGDTNIKYLNDNGVTIWDEWANENGDLGPVYGKQWRSWSFIEKVELPHMSDINGKVYTHTPRTIDQIKWVEQRMRTHPDCRRMIVSAWNPVDLPHMALAPCHCLFQFYIVDRRLSCQLYQRSADVFLGVPYNIASYALLTMMFARVNNLELGEFIHTFGDVHIYSNHMEQVDLQLSREPRSLPEMLLSNVPESVTDFLFQDFILRGYHPHPAIKAPVAV